MMQNEIMKILYLSLIKYMRDIKSWEEIVG